MYLTCPESNIEPQPTVNVGQAADPTYPLAGPPWDKRDPPDGSWRTPKEHSHRTDVADEPAAMEKKTEEGSSYGP